GIVGCSSGTSSVSAAQSSMLPVVSSAPGSAPQADAALCTASGQFQAAVANLSSLRGAGGDAAAVKTAVQDVANTGGNLANAAQNQYPAQVADLRQAAASLKSAVTGLTDQGSLSSNLGAVMSSLASVGVAAGGVLSPIKHSCPAPSSAPPAPSSVPPAPSAAPTS
ncbi:MAG TPA: hypothetical protein VGJ13_20390, partial [Pseudonocardiaceae bacterium]